MIRKQLYLEEAQDRALKRRAQELGVSEAEVVRRALDQALRSGDASLILQRKQQNLQAFFEDADEIMETRSLPEDFRFERDSTYEEDGKTRGWHRDL